MAESQINTIDVIKRTCYNLFKYEIYLSNCRRPYFPLSGFVDVLTTTTPAKAGFFVSSFVSSKLDTILRSEYSFACEVIHETNLSEGGWVTKLGKVDK